MHPHVLYTGLFFTDPWKTMQFYKAFIFLFPLLSLLGMSFSCFSTWNILLTLQGWPWLPPIWSLPLSSEARWMLPGFLGGGAGNKGIVLWLYHQHLSKCLQYCKQPNSGNQTEREEKPRSACFHFIILTIIPGGTHHPGFTDKGTKPKWNKVNLPKATLQITWS